MFRDPITGQIKRLNHRVELRGEFVEEQHPRKGGKFAPKGEGGQGAAPLVKPKRPTPADPTSPPAAPGGLQWKRSSKLTFSGTSGQVAHTDQHRYEVTNMGHLVAVDKKTHTGKILGYPGSQDQAKQMAADHAQQVGGKPQVGARVPKPVVDAAAREIATDHHPAAAAVTKDAAAEHAQAEPLSKAEHVEAAAEHLKAMGSTVTPEQLAHLRTAMAHKEAAEKAGAEDSKQPVEGEKPQKGHGKKAKTEGGEDYGHGESEKHHAGGHEEHEHAEHGGGGAVVADMLKDLVEWMGEAIPEPARG